MKCDVVRTTKADQLSVNQEMSARNATNARAQYFMVTCAFHPLVFAHCTRLENANRKDSCARACVCLRARACVRVCVCVLLVALH